MIKKILKKIFTGLMILICALIILLSAWCFVECLSGAWQSLPSVVY